ncbi:MAG TPA: ABC transporter permease [Thermoanaerobaculia bacterium]|nr:ABC transporter permease [Thermoanaerobaculia bacterium]
MKPEHWLLTAPLRLRSIFRRGRVEAELDEELRFHLDRKTEEGIAQGLSPEEARRRARLAMGGLDQRKEEIRDTRRVHWLTDFFDDLRYAFRSLRRTPGLTAFIVVTISLGIGMTATPFSMLDALVFRPYPVPRSADVLTLVSTSRDNAFENFSYREYLDIRDHVKSYDGVIANSSVSGVGFTADPKTPARLRAGILVSGNYFRVLGVEPTIGRSFSDDEDRAPGRDALVVLAPGFWKREFGSDPTVVGRVVRVNGAPFTVIGVAPESFTGMFIFTQPDLYFPLAMAKTFSTNPARSFFDDRDDRELTVRGRLRRGATLQQARHELEGLARSLEGDYPKTNRGRGAAVHTLVEMRTRPDEGNWKFGLIFTILALAVLLVACTNVAGLLISRARTRTREIAVRLAIGASRIRLIRLLLAESLVLALFGGLGGIAVGYVGIDLLRRFRIPAELPVEIPFRMDSRVLLASLALSVLCAIFCGLAPALQSSRTDLVHGLKSADGEETGRRRLWGRNALVVAQVAMSLMLLAAAFLMARGFHASLVEGTGFSRELRLFLRFDPRLVQYTPAQTRQFYEKLSERVKDLPGVQSAAYTKSPPLGLENHDMLAFVPEGFAMPRERESFSSMSDIVDEGFFETLGIPILRGRAFQRADTAESPRVAIVNENFASHYWPNQEAVGKRIRLENAAGPAVEIVGVCRAVKYDLGVKRFSDFVYLPLSQNPVARLVLLLKSGGDPLDLVGPVTEAVRTLDANMPISETRTFEDLYQYVFVNGPGVAINLVATLGGVGLILAIAGLYGLVSYNVARRTREIGIRIAIGAKPSDVLRLTMSKGLKLVAIGTAFGLVLGVAIERLMNSMIFNAGGTDMLVYVVVVPAMLLVTIVAAYVPARRATRIAPTLALRCE